MVAGKTTPIAEPLRIAMLSLHSSPLGPLGTRDTGGMSVYVRQMARQMACAGNEVDIFTYVPCADAVIHIDPNVRLIELDHEQKRAISKERLFDHLDQMAGALKRFTRSDQAAYDVVHSHYWISGCVGAAVSKQWHSPHLITFHTLGLIKNITTEGEAEPEVRIIHERQLVNSVDAVVVPSDGERRHLRNLYGAASEKVHTIPCGVNLEQFQPMDRNLARRRLNIDPAAMVLLFVGRFAPVKGMGVLLQAFAEASLQCSAPVHLVVVGGDGAQAQATRAFVHKAKDLGIASRIRMAGRVEHDALPRYYNAADMLVLPSTYESFGLVTLEALACGTPVVATRVGGASAAIREGVNGTLIDQPDGLSVAKGIERVWGRLRNNELFPEQVRDSVSAYGWDRVSTVMLSLYDAIRTGRLPD